MCEGELLGFCMIIFPLPDCSPPPSLCPSLLLFHFLLPHTSTIQLLAFRAPVNTSLNTRPADRAKEGRGFAGNPLPFLTFNYANTSRRHNEVEEAAGRAKAGARLRCQTKTSTHHWFHCWSPRPRLSKCRISEEDKTEIKQGRVSQKPDHQALTV